MLNDVEFKKIFPFEQPRQLQRTIINKIIDAYKSGKKHVILQAPTGIGKSVIAMAITNYFNGSYILTSQKVLQEQYHNDFDIPMVKGKSNYNCLRDYNLTCEFGNCKKIKQEYPCKDCLYETNKKLAYNNYTCVLNYSYFFAMNKSKLQIPRHLMVLDEAHNLESELISSTTIKLNKKYLLKLNVGETILLFPNKTETVENKFKWLFEIITPAFEDLAKKDSDLLGTYDKNSKKDKQFYSAVRRLLYLKQTLEIIDLLYNEYKQKTPSVVIQNNEDEIEFKLLFGKGLFEKLITPYSNKTLSMSATLFNREYYCKMLGINVEDCVIIKCPSLFPIENRPIYYQPIGKLTYKEKQKTYPKLVKKVEDILNIHKEEKGIIHTTNYEIANLLINEIKSDRFVMPRGKYREDQLKDFMSSKEPLVLISPSLQEGVDLKEDLSRFSIICKIPYANISDPWISQRNIYDKYWYTNNTIETLVQSTGRSVRSETDYAKSYILDSSFMLFLNRNKKYIPKWWSESVIKK